MEYSYKGYKIKIEQDPDPESPRTWDNLGYIMESNTKYDLGDVKETPEIIKKTMKRKDIIWLPYYLMDHGSISVSTVDFGCQGDSAQIGIICVTREKVKKDFGIKRITQEWVDKIKDQLKSEVETMNQHLQGDVHGYSIEDTQGNDIDSCWGFYCEDYCKMEAEDVVDSYIPKSIKFVKKISE